jgi:hypothetical protein
LYKPHVHSFMRTKLSKTVESDAGEPIWKMSVHFKCTGCSMPLSREDFHVGEDPPSWWGEPKPVPFKSSIDMHVAEIATTKVRV